ARRRFSAQCRCRRIADRWSGVASSSNLDDSMSPYATRSARHPNNVRLAGTSPDILTDLIGIHAAEPHLIQRVAGAPEIALADDRPDIDQSGHHRHLDTTLASKRGHRGDTIGDIIRLIAMLERARTGRRVERGEGRELLV